jgi:HSP20 family protein
MAKKISRALQRIRDEINNILEKEKFGELIDLPMQKLGTIIDLGDYSYPDVDIIDRGELLIITFDMPGLKKEDISLNVEESKIEVKADKSEKAIEKKENYYRAERIYKGFYRKIQLPEKIVPEKAEAFYIDGVLEIKAPKIEIKKSKIKIK